MLATFVLCSSFHIGPVARAPSSRVPATCWMNAKGEPNADKLDPKNNLVDPSLRPELPTGTAFDPAQPLYAVPSFRRYTVAQHGVVHGEEQIMQAPGPE